eukprot:GHRR01027271.1.p1 GENE.GHRR01027271.1~~GHRR01027271.1.p1  ORF type:complete len:245 (+),score=56.35 GHRR01027271.1:113-847(+)
MRAVHAYSGRTALRQSTICRFQRAQASTQRYVASGTKRPEDLRVAIIGAGVGGPALAMLLKKHLGCTPVVFEAANVIKEVGAGISLAPNGLRALDSLGLAQRICKEVGEPMQTMHVSRPDNSTIVSFPTLAMEQYGFPMTGVRRFRLLNVLLDKMEQMGIPLEFGKRLVDIQQPDQQKAAAIATATASSSKSSGTSSTTSAPAGPAVLHFQDGNAYEADLVVGFDGLRSRTRALLKGGNEPPPR